MPARCALAAAAALTLSAPAPAAGAAPAVPLGRLVGETIVGALTAPPSPAFLARVRAGRVGGVILVGHWRSEAAMAATTARLQTAACTTGAPLLVGVDQEGGRVRRLPWAPPRDSPAALGRLDDPDRVEKEAANAAVDLRLAGVDVDFAPVADTVSRPRSFLGARAFSSDPAVVSTLAGSFVDGLQSTGVAATAKHFPGLGAAPANTDDRPVVVRASAATLTRGLAPFRAAIAAGVKLVLVSSASYPALDPAGGPAVFSRPIVSGLLRGKLGFDGVVVTDALDAPAVASTPHAPARAIDAGVDLLLYTGESASEAGYESLLADASASATLRRELGAAAARIDALKQWLVDAGGPYCPG
ncbi:MAG TPA: glycoside hydrolase family 3 N-terminal domain-containing protein [Gaiellaceae bacterium]|nr:glycoside hydrolase family 3 N-terminal domain-containing protein [Gaiellaceae bacterium]